MLSRGRVLKAADATSQTPLSALPAELERRRAVLRRERAEAHAEAQAILDAARAQAERVLNTARDEAKSVRDAAEQDGFERGRARAAEEALQWAQAQAAADEQAQGRVVEMARLLAERLLGSALELEPQRVSQLALEVLSEVRGARRVRLFCHPSATALVERALSTAKLGSLAVEVREDEQLQLTDSRLETDVGVLDARLTTRLDLLCRALSERVR
jgi:type III secretion system HrpE/YscL family protein